jgi:biotin transport system substrate-specific component
MILSKAYLSNPSLGRQALLVLSGSLVIALSAQISVPMFPVPMTLQTMAVILVGLTLGWRLGAASVLAYLAEGAAGLPFFANGGFGIAPLMGPTAGYLWGFVAQAALAGWLAERGMGRGLVKTFFAAMVAALFIYVPGVLWLQAVTPLDLVGAAKAGALPFLPGDVVKAALAALIVAGGWKALSNLRG